jgi:hypothetical protein
LSIEKSIFFIFLVLFSPGSTANSAILLLAASGMSDNKQQEIVPALEVKCPEEGAQRMVEFLPPPEIRTGFYKVSIPEYHQPVNQKRQKIQNTLYLSGMLLSVPEIVFQVVSAILQDIVIIFEQICIPNFA